MCLETRGYIGVYIGIMESKTETANIRRQWQISAPPRIFLCVFRNMTPVESARDPVVSLQLAYIHIYIYIPIGWLWGTVVLIQAHALQSISGIRGISRR